MNVYSKSLLLIFSLLFIVSNVSAITPIQEHPNLFYNQEEIDVLRNMLLVDTISTPSHLLSAWNNVRGTTATTKPPVLGSWPESYTTGLAWTKPNVNAALSYMIEPTPAKAQAIKNSLMSWYNAGDLLTDSQTYGHVPLAIAFLYDVSYNDPVWTDAERNQLNTWFANAAKYGARTDWYGLGGYDFEIITKEGTSRQFYANQDAFKAMAIGLYALVSGDQVAVDAAFDGQWSSTNFLLPDYNPNTNPITNPRNLHNFVVGEVYPSGATWDGYKRGYGTNFDPSIDEYTGQIGGSGQHYHFYSLLALSLGAEAATHNGLDLWAANNDGLLRAYIIGAPWAGQAYWSNPGSTPRTYDERPHYWLAHRAYPNDATVNQVLASANYPNSNSWVSDGGFSLFGYPTRDQVGQTNPNPGTPYITNVPTLTDDAIVTIQGIEFGTKSPVAPLFWDTVDNQPEYNIVDGEIVPVQVDGCANCPWRDNNDDSAGPPRFSTELPRASHPHYRAIGKGYFRGPNDWPVTDDLIANWWMRVDATPGLYPAPSYSNFKFSRLYADSSGLSGNGGCTAQTHQSKCSGVSSDPVDSTPWGGNVPFIWNHIEIISDDAGGFTNGQGEYSFLVNNNLRHYIDNVRANFPLREFWIHGFDSLADWRDNMETARMDWGEIYVDNTQAKIALGDAPNWGAVEHWEVQIPVSDWDRQEGNRITFEVNLGSFTQQDIDSGLYLFVFDEDGDVSPGFPVTVGQPTNPNPGIPYITNVPTLSDDSVVTINGLDFGSHGDYHPDADKLVDIWEDFETGTFNGDYVTWGLFAGTDVNTISSQQSRPNSDFNYRRVNDGNDLGNIASSLNGEQEIFISMYTRLQDDFSSLFDTASGQWKFTRINAGNSDINLYPVYNTRDGLSMANEFIVPFTNTGDNSFPGTYSLDGWHRWDWYIKTSDNNNGENIIWIDNQRVYDYNRDVSPTPNGGGLGYDTNGAIFDSTIAIGSYSKHRLAPAYVDFDDIYVSYTLARVELCNNSDFLSSTQCELQIPQVWNDGSVTFEVNLGAFTQVDIDSGLYLFVIDADGDVSPGHLVSITGSVSECSTDPDCSSYGDGICTVGVCNAGTCEQQFTNNSCNDGNICTSGDVCSQGVCDGTPNSASCSDGVSCTVGDVCSNGECTPGTPTPSLCPSNPDCSGVMCTVSGCQYTECSYDSSLVALYPLDSNYFDLVNNNHFSCFGSCPTDSVGKVNGAVSFESNSVLIAADSPLNSGLSQVTVMGWVNPKDWSAHPYQFIFAKSGYSGDREFRIRSENSNVLVWQVSNDTLDPQDKEVTTSLPPLNEWTHLAGTFDGSTLRLYVNGVEVASGPGEGGPIADGNAKFSIGGSSDNIVDSNFVGGIDEVRLYNAALSSSAIAQIYSSESTGGSSSFDVFDFDSDGSIGIEDLFILSQYFGGIFVDGDYDNDGKITIIDLLKHINNWN